MMSYGNPSNRPTADIPVTVFTSVLTSIFVTVGILFFTGNLLPKSEDEASAAASESVSDESTVEAPPLKGLTVAVAGEVLRARGLRLVVEEERPDNTIPKGQICEQDPLQGSELNAGGAVAVVVSTGVNAVAIPDVSGKSLEDAKVALVEAGFKVGEITEADTGVPGTVLETAPKKGAAAEPGTEVDIAVTRAITVPKVVGMYSNKAKQTLTEAGFKIGKIKWGDTDAYDAHVVLAQEPEPETIALPGAEIALTINSE